MTAQWSDRQGVSAACIDGRTRYMVLPLASYEVILTRLERIARIESARTLANEASDALTQHAPNSWIPAGMEPDR